LSGFGLGTQLVEAERLLVRDRCGSRVARSRIARSGIDRSWIAWARAARSRAARSRAARSRAARGKVAGVRTALSGVGLSGTFNRIGQRPATGEQSGAGQDAPASQARSRVPHAQLLRCHAPRRNRPACSKQLARQTAARDQSATSSGHSRLRGTLRRTCRTSGRQRARRPRACALPSGRSRPGASPDP
jgi:hypothetical protein